MRLLGNICKHAPSCILSRNIEKIANLDNDVQVIGQHGEEGLPCTKNERFVNPPMFYFCSNSPSVMVKLRKECLKLNEFMFTVGAHFFVGRRKYRHTYPYFVFYHAKLGVVCIKGKITRTGKKNVLNPYSRIKTLKRVL